MSCLISVQMLPRFLCTSSQKVHSFLQYVPFKCPRCTVYTVSVNVEVGGHLVVAAGRLALVAGAEWPDGGARSGGEDG